MEKVALDSAVVTALNIAVQVANFAVFAGIAALFGANWQTDAFFLAMTIPAFFVGAVVNAITSVFVPVIAECRARRPHALGQLIGSALVYVFALSALAAVAVTLVSPILLRLTARGLSLAAQQLAVRHTLFLVPMIAFQTTAAVLAATFNSAGKFWIPPGTDFAGTLATFALIVALKPALGIISLPAAFVAGALLHLILLAAFWRKVELRLAFGWRLEPDLARSFRLALPLIVGVAALQLSVVISRLLAAQLPAGSVSVLDYANRIAVGVMELLTSGVFLVTLADWSQVVAQGDMTLLRAKLRQTILMVLFVVLPAVAVLVPLRGPVIAVALQRGQFDAGLTTLTGGVLIFFLLGIPADVIARTYVRLFLVWQDTWTLGKLATLRLIAATLLSLGLMRVFQVRGLALADALAILLITLCLIALANRRLGNTLSGLGLPLIKLGVTAAAAGAAATLLLTATPGVAVWLKLPAAAALGGACYLIAAWLLRVDELNVVFRLIARRKATAV